MFSVIIPRKTIIFSVQSIACNNSFNDLYTRNSPCSFKNSFKFIESLLESLEKYKMGYFLKSVSLIKLVLEFILLSNTFLFDSNDKKPLNQVFFKLSLFQLKYSAVTNGHK